MQELAYTVVGPSDSVPVVFLHGFMGAGSEWNAIADSLSDEFRCLLIDLPGHGRTKASEEGTDYALPAAAQALLAVLKREQIESAHIVGYSMGARLALYLAVHHPRVCRRVVMESGSPGLLEKAAAAARRRADEQWAVRFEREPLEQVIAAWYRQSIFNTLISDPALYEEVKRARLLNRPHELARSMRGMSVGRQVPLWDVLPGLKLPLYVLYGELDRKYGEIARLMADRNPLIQTRMLPGVGHNVHAEQPVAFATTLRSCLLEKHIRQEDQ